MFYTLIIIAKCNRFTVSDRDYIKIEPTTKVQMILGTNGSGKSMLARLGFSPLPIDPKWMDKGGYWIKEGNYKGDSYRLEGRYDTKPAFTFIKNGEVLLQDGGITLYTDMVKQHFGCTKWLHDLHVGKTRFVELSGPQRQDLLSNIANSDFTLAFKELARYKKLLSHHTSINQFLQQRINEETTRLIDEDEYIRLTQRKGELTEEYQELTKLSFNEYDDLPHPNILRDALVGKIERYLKTLPISPIVNDYNALEDTRQRLTAILNNLAGKEEMLLNRVMDRQQELGVLDAEGTDVESMVKELAELSDALTSLGDPVKPIPIEYLEEVPMSVVNAIVDVASMLPIDEINLDELLSIEREVFEKDITLRRYSDGVERLSAELTLLTQREMITCPNCQTNFRPGVGEHDISTLRERIAKGRGLVEVSEKELIPLTTRLVDLKDKKQITDQLAKLKETYRNTYPGFIQYLESQGSVARGRGVGNAIYTYQSTWNHHQKKRVLVAKIERLQHATQHIQNNEGVRKQLVAELASDNDLLNDLYAKMKEVEHECATVTQFKDTLLKDQQFEESIEQDVVDLIESIDALYASMGKRVKQEEMERVLSQIATLEGTLSAQDTVRGRIADFETQLKVSRNKAIVLGLLVEELSPKTGIIAKQIRLSVGGIVDGLNQLFKRIWGYSLTVKMGSVGEDGLDYKFPIMDSKGSRDDVSEGSDSMLEMVNRSVSLMSYYSLNLQDHPLFLDEIGRAFDKVHKLNLIPFIRELADNPRFSQIVIISHSEDVQTAFPNSQTIILDDRNIDYPYLYNEHVTFTEGERACL